MIMYAIEFSQDPRTIVLFLLIICDLVLGVTVSIQTGIFDAKKLGLWYERNVVPYLVGYFAVWFISKWAPASVLSEFPQVAEVIAQMGATIGFLPGMSTLLIAINQKRKVFGNGNGNWNWYGNRNRDGNGKQ